MRPSVTVALKGLPLPSLVWRQPNISQRWSLSLWIWKSLIITVQPWKMYLSQAFPAKGKKDAKNPCTTSAISPLRDDEFMLLLLRNHSQGKQVKEFIGGRKALWKPSSKNQTSLDHIKSLSLKKTTPTFLHTKNKILIRIPLLTLERISIFLSLKQKISVPV